MLPFPWSPASPLPEEVNDDIANLYFSLQKVHKIRITLTSRKVASLEKVCQELIERAKNKDLRAKGPVRLPTKTLKITVRFFRNRLISLDIQDTNSRDHRPARPPVVRVPRLGTATRCASTSA